MKKFIQTTFLLLILSCTQSKCQNSESVNNSKTAQQRKSQTEKILAKNNIPFIEHLPLIEEESEAKIRKPNEIAERILILTYLSYVAEVPKDKKIVIDFLKKYNLWSKVSIHEKELFEKSTLTEHEKVEISWKCEAIWVLLWSINKVEKLEMPNETINVEEILARIPHLFHYPEEFIKTAKVRSTSEILDMSDLIYRIHWAVRDAYLNQKSAPGNMDEEIVMERHLAINWITYYTDDWDDVTTDT